MIRTLRLKLSIDNPNALFKTFDAYTRAYNVCSTWGYQNKTYNKISNHNATYHKIREEIPELPSSLLQCARDCACEALKATKCKSLPTRKPYASMRYNKRVINVNLIKQFVSISTVEGRITSEFVFPHYYDKYSHWNVKSSNLQYKKQSKEFYLLVQVESIDEIEFNDPVNILGIDRGLKNIATCSDNTFFGGSQIKNVRDKYCRLRAKLQSKGTKSAKRLLKRLSGKERRFMTDINHCIAKEIVSKPYTVFILEDLNGIRLNVNKGKKLNRWISSWSFYQLEQFIDYKSEGLSKIVIKIDPAYTSQECSNCGCIEKSNRKGSTYKCKECGFNLNSDLNASRNIANRGMTVVSRVLSTTLTHQH